MPEPWRLERVEGGGQVFVYRGPHLFAHYDADDLGMRNLAIVGLTNAGSPAVRWRLLRAHTPVRLDC